MKIEVNEPCPCGSGKKYKRCCRERIESPMTFWRTNLQKIVDENGISQNYADVFFTFVRFISGHGLEGVCHLASTALHLMYKELGLESSLCTGVVYVGEGCLTPHSWVEVDGKVHDVTAHVTRRVRFTKSPLFHNVFLDGMDAGEITYGVNVEGFVGDAGTEEMLENSVAKLLTANFDPIKGADWWDVLVTVSEEAKISIFEIGEDGSRDVPTLYKKYENERVVLKNDIILDVGEVSIA